MLNITKEYIYKSSEVDKAFKKAVFLVQTAEIQIRTQTYDGAYMLVSVQLIDGEYVVSGELNASLLETDKEAS